MRTAFKLKFPADIPAWHRPGKHLFGGRRRFMMLHGLGAVTAIRRALTRARAPIIGPVRIRSKCLSVDNAMVLLTTAAVVVTWKFPELTFQYVAGP
jgi:hypothetical protein